MCAFAETGRLQHSGRIPDLEGMIHEGIDRVGLSPTYISKIEREISPPSSPALSLSVLDYTDVMAFIQGVFSEDLSGRTIAEIGMGQIGATMLGYLNRKGAHVIGVDCYYKPTAGDLQAFGIEFIPDRWERIAGHLGGRDIDLIYTQYMQDNPESGGPLDLFGGLYLDHGGFRDRIRRDFEVHIADQMEQCLKPGGFFVMANHDTGVRTLREYKVTYISEFEKKGFRHYLFPGIRRGTENITVFQKYADQVLPSAMGR
jgi:hypothetical protein